MFTHPTKCSSGRSLSTKLSPHGRRWFAVSEEEMDDADCCMSVC